MKNKKNVILLVAIFVFVSGMAYADVDTPQFFVPVQAEIVVPTVTVTMITDGLNFGQLLPDLDDPAYVLMDVSTVTRTENPANAQTKADATTATDQATEALDMTADVVLDGTKTRTAGGFTLVSDRAASVTIVFSDSLVLTSDVIPDFGAPATMTVSDIQIYSNHDGDVLKPIALAAGAPQYFHIGGQLAVAAAQGGGTYTNLDGGLQVDIALQ